MVKKKVLRSSVNKESYSILPFNFANSLGLTVAAFLLIYAIIVWMSDYTGSALAGLFPIPFRFDGWSFIVGLAQAYVVGYVFGWIFARSYNKHLRVN